MAGVELKKSSRALITFCVFVVVCVVVFLCVFIFAWMVVTGKLFNYDLAFFWHVCFNFLFKRKKIKYFPLPQEYM